MQSADFSGVCQVLQDKGVGAGQGSPEQLPSASPVAQRGANHDYDADHPENDDGGLPERQGVTGSG
jgi:hypothetical protein